MGQAQRRSPQSSRPIDYPPFPEMLPMEAIEHGSYRVRFARTWEEVDQLLQLRYRVFNLELGEGLDSSVETERDEDPFDVHCHHLIVEMRDTGEVIGTYRMQTSEMAEQGQGFYTAGEFDLDRLPEEISAEAFEIGRACISRDHRNRQVLFLLWKGLAQYVMNNRKRYLFGCCSLTSQDPAEGAEVLAFLAGRGHLHSTITTPPLEGLECLPKDSEITPLTEAPRTEIPALFKTYLRYGAKVLGPPAIDREFKTIDFCVLLDVQDLDPRSRRLFFDESASR